MAQAFLNGSRYNSNVSDLALLIERSITEIEIPKGISSIGAYAFKNCHAITGKVTVPEGVMSLGREAFSSCLGITKVDLPDSLTTIERACFFFTKALESFVLPPNVSDIPVAMLSASAIKEFTARGHVSSIAGESFDSCRACLKFDFTACTRVPTLGATNAFLGINAKAKILVPSFLYDEWIVATNWSAYADYIEPYYTVSEGLEYETDNYGNKYVIGRGSCTDSVIVIPDGITAIAGGAFANDTLIDTLILPESGVTIECRASDGLGGVQGSSLRKIVNYYNAIGFAFSGLSLEYISFVETPWAINGFVFMSIQGSPTYDFSKCTAVVQISGDVEYMSVGEETQIIVPASLYDEWIADTNWAYYADYIVAAE